MTVPERQSLNQAQAAHLIRMTLEESRSSTSQSFAPGERLGNYVLKRLLGSGAFGVVWEASQTEPVKRDVAVKILRPGMDIEESSDRFRIEGCALARMNHPGIAAVLDIGTLPSGQPYFVMELVNGVSITKYCEQKDLTLRQRLLLMVQVCHAVQHAHQRAVLHRDLKPSNILVTEVDGQPQPKVIDFGIAKPMTDEVTGDLTLARTVRGMMLGTPRYMAPEQTALNGDVADVRADVYALGTILYELITGVTPVGDDDSSTDTLPALLKRICEDEPRRPSLLLRQCPPGRLTGFVIRDLQELDWVILKALEKQPDNRYPSADALADDLTAFCDHQPLSVGPPGLGYRAHKLIQRHRAPVAASLVVLVCITISAFISINAFLDESKAHIAAERSSIESAANARLATAAVQFLSQLLQESGHQVGAGANATALRAALRSGEERLKEINAQPELVATLCDQMAFTYEAMGDVAQAVPLYERAAQVHAQLRGDNAVSTLDARMKQALALSNCGDQALAVPIMEDVVKRWAAKGESFEGKSFEVRRRLAHALSTVNRGTEGLALMQTLLEAKDDKGRTGRESLSFMRGYAEMQASCGDIAGARATLEECLKANDSKRSASAGKTRSAILLSLARVEAKEKKFTTAAQHFQLSLEAGREAGGTDHQSEIDILIEEARAFENAKLIDDALRCVDDAEVIARNADNRRQLSHCYVARAQMCKINGRLAEAIPSYRAFIANTGEDNPSSLRLWLDANKELVQCLDLLGRYEEGRQHAAEFWAAVQTDARLQELPQSWVLTLSAMVTVTSKWKAAAQSESMNVQLAEWQATIDRLSTEALPKSAAR